jgi:hypothetical protein
MKWRNSDLDFDRNCVFIDEAGFNINMRNNWARSTVGTPAIVEIEKATSPFHIIIGSIHSSSVIHVAMKKSPPRRERTQKPLTSKSEKAKKRKLTRGKDQRVNEIIEEPVIEYGEVENIDDREANKPLSKGTTTAHFIKFMNELLDIMDMDESLKGTYLVMDNCTIHKSHPMVKKLRAEATDSCIYLHIRQN